MDQHGDEESESMTARHDKIDRRALLKLLGTAGASASAFSAAGVNSLGSTTVSAAGGAQSGIESFEIRVSDAELDDLHRRLSNVRWPPDPPGEAWEQFWRGWSRLALLRGGTTIAGVPGGVLSSAGHR